MPGTADNNDEGDTFTGVLSTTKADEFMNIPDLGSSAAKPSIIVGELNFDILNRRTDTRALQHLDIIESFGFNFNNT
jgi:hypothetical protein